MSNEQRAIRLKTPDSRLQTPKIARAKANVLARLSRTFGVVAERAFGAMRMKLGLLAVCLILLASGCSEQLATSDQLSPADFFASTEAAVVTTVEAADLDTKSVPRLYASPKLTFNASPEVMERAKRILWPKRGADIPWVIHGLRTFAREGRNPEGYPSRDELLQVLLNDRVCTAWYPGMHCLIGTRSGLRYLHEGSSPASQSHIDQSLATLAELGIDLDTTIITASGEDSLRHVLSDSMANFSPDAEIEWSSIAFAYYIPPSRTWSNRFDEQYCFDDLISFLMHRPFDRTSCGGTHVLYSIATILGVDRQCPILSDATRDLAREFLRLAVFHAVRSQQPDGSIDPAWYATFVASAGYESLCRESAGSSLMKKRIERSKAWENIFQKQEGEIAELLVTGHQLEWMLLLPEDLWPGHDFVEKCSKYLASRLEFMPEQISHEAVCPYSHAYYVLSSLSKSH